jgi:dolichyl-phosphate beta-glucosyltransferase
LLAFTPSPVPAIPSEQHYTDATYPDDPQPLPSLQDPATIALSVIVPAFNEVDRLAAMVDEAVEFLIGPAIEQAKFGKLQVRSDVTELIVVDDGSTDGTSGKALELAKEWSVRDGARNVEIRVITLAKNRGKGGAVQHVSEVASLALKSNVIVNRA